jgi:hypothetical protein
VLKNYFFLPVKAIDFVRTRFFDGKSTVLRILRANSTVFAVGIFSRRIRSTKYNAVLKVPPLSLTGQKRHRQRGGLWQDLIFDAKIEYTTEKVSSTREAGRYVSPKKATENCFCLNKHTQKRKEIIEIDKILTLVKKIRTFLFFNQ